MTAEDENDGGRRRFLQQALGAAGVVGLGGWMAAGDARSRRRGRKTVRLWHLLSGEWQAPTERVAELFNESQGAYEVVPLLIPDKGADSKFLLAVAGGDPPDVMLHWTQAMSTWAEGGILQPLDRFMTAEEMRRFVHESYPVIAKSGWHEGHLYGLAEGFDLFVCYYRLDHFREAGLDSDRFPETLEALMEVGEKLHRFDRGGNLTRVGFLPQGLNSYVAAFGGGFHNETTGELTLNTPANLRTLSFLVESRKKLGLEKVLRFTSSLSSGSGVDWPFIGGAVSVALDGEWRVEQLRLFAPHLEYRTIPLPPPAGGKPLSSFSVTNFLTIPTGAREPDGAWEFIKFWTGLQGPERAAEYYPWFGWMPMGPLQEQAPVYQTYLEQNPQYRTFLQVARSRNIVITPPVPYQLYLMDRINRAYDLATRGTLSPDQALRELERDMEKERSRRRGLGYAD